MMQLGMDGVFVGSGIFKSGDPAKRARAIVQVGIPCLLCPSFASSRFAPSPFGPGLAFLEPLQQPLYGRWSSPCSAGPMLP